MLRKRFIAEMNKRFLGLRGKINELIITKDVLGLKSTAPFSMNIEAQAWRFRTDSQKLDSFNSWFKGQVDEGILTTTGPTATPWTSPYVESAYRKGVVRAYVDTHKEALAQKADFYEGSKAQFLQDAFNHPETMSKLNLLATRTFEELKGITAAMGQQTSRILANGLAQGQGPAEIARGLNKAVTGITRKRARVLARTEIIHAHAEGQLDSFERLGIEEVGVMAEWSTAGDDRVCPKCEAIEGEIMTVAEARGQIPLHPNCRCAWIPALKEAKALRKPKPKARLGVPRVKVPKFKKKKPAVVSDPVLKKRPPVVPKITPSIKKATAARVEKAKGARNAVASDIKAPKEFSREFARKVEERYNVYLVYEGDYSQHQLQVLLDSLESLHKSLSADSVKALKKLDSLPIWSKKGLRAKTSCMGEYNVTNPRINYDSLLKGFAGKKPALSAWGKMDWVVKHEYSHHVWFKTLGRKTKKSWEVLCKGFKGRWVTEYAGENAVEAFAECATAYLEAPAALKKMMPSAFDWMKKNMFTGGAK